MRLLHCADLHIGKSRSFPDYMERPKVMLQEILRIATTMTDGLIIIGGDIYDTKSLRPKEKDLFIDFVCEADASGLTVVMVKGNHDMVDETDGGYSNLRTIQKMIDHTRLNNVHLIENEPQWLFLPKWNLGVVGLPAFYRQDSNEVNVICRTLIKQLQAQHGKDIQIVGIIHETVTGSTNDEGFIFKQGIQLDPKLPFTYIALGDIHKPQIISGVPNARYSGSPVQHTFGDKGVRGVLVVDTDDPCNAKLIPLNVEKLITINVADGESVVIPPNAIVKVEASKQQLASMDLPANVVKTKTTVSNAQLAIASVGMFDGLTEILAELGMDETDQQFSLDLVQKL